MSLEVIKKGDKKYVLQMEIELDASSMLNSEEQIQLAVNALGKEATKLAMHQYDTIGEPIVKDGITMSSKGILKKTIRPPMEK